MDFLQPSPKTSLFVATCFLLRYCLSSDIAPGVNLFSPLERGLYLGGAIFASFLKSLVQPKNKFLLCSKHFYTILSILVGANSIFFLPERACACPIKHCAV